MGGKGLRNCEVVATVAEKVLGFCGIRVGDQKRGEGGSGAEGYVSDKH